MAFVFCAVGLITYEHRAEYKGVFGQAQETRRNLN